MIFQEVEINNFLSIEHAVVQFSAGLHAVQGINFDMSVDGTESNATGKSALCGESIEWALWGKLSRVETPLADSVVNKIVGKDCYVKVRFESNGKQWEVLRTRKHSELGNSLSWSIDGVPMAPVDLDTGKKQLEEQLPISHNVFRYAIQVGQGMNDRFLSLSETEKQDLLSDILDLNMFDDALQASANTVNTLDAEIGSRGVVLKDVAADIERAELGLAQAKVEVETSLANLEALKKTTDRLRQEADAEKEAVASKERDLSALHLAHSSRNNELQEAIKNISEKRESIEKLVGEAQEKEKEGLKQWNAGLSELATKKHQASLESNTQQAKLVALTKQLEKISGVLLVCPTCGQKLTEDTSLDAERKSLTSQLELEATTKAKLQENYRAFEFAEKEFQAKYKEAEKTWGEYVEKVRRSVKDQTDALYAPISSLSDSLKASGHVIEQTGQVLQRSRMILEGKERAYSKSKEDRASLESILARADERKLLAEKSLKSLQDSSVKAKILLEESHNKLKHWQYWKDSIPNLRAAAMEEILSFLNERIGQYMMEFSGGVMGVDIYQVPYGKKSKIKVNLRTPGGTYEMSSGGERRRVDLAIYLALSDLLYLASGVQCNVLIADEIMDGLSAEGVKKFSEILRRKADNGMSVFIISHSPVIRQIIEYDTVLTVEKKGGLARLVCETASR